MHKAHCLSSIMSGLSFEWWVINDIKTVPISTNKNELVLDPVLRLKGEADNKSPLTSLDGIGNIGEMMSRKRKLK